MGELTAVQPLAEGVEESDYVVLLINLFCLHHVAVHVENDELPLTGGQLVDPLQLLREEVHTQVVEQFQQIVSRVVLAEVLQVHVLQSFHIQPLPQHNHEDAHFQVPLLVQFFTDALQKLAENEVHIGFEVAVLIFLHIDFDFFLLLLVELLQLLLDLVVVLQIVLVTEVVENVLLVL